MSLRIAAATGGRVLSQLRRDPRTVALLLVVPCVLVTLLKYMFVDRSFVFDRIGGPLLGLFPFIAMSSSPRSRCCASGRPARSSA